MTTETQPAQEEQQDTEVTIESSDPWESAVAGIAAQMSNPNFPEEDLNDLAYRLNPEHPERATAGYWRVLTRQGLPLDDQNPAELEVWAVIIAGTARIAERGPNTGGRRRNPHNADRPAGRALRLGTGGWGSPPPFEETEMELLLNNRGRPLRRQMLRAMRAIAEDRANCNLVQLANMLRYDLLGCRDELAQAKLPVAQAYYMPQQAAT